jgi:hypothetical protein
LFASILAYQLVNLLIAAALAAALVRGPADRWAGRLARRFPRALATPFRWLALAAFPAFLATILAAALAGQFFLFRAVDRFASGYPAVQRMANFGLFLVLGVAYPGIFVVFPLLGAWRAWREPAADPAAAARRRADRWLAAAAILLAAGVGGYATFVEPRRIVIEEVDVALPGWPAGRPPLRVVLLSDLQSARLSDHERLVPDLVAALRPDAILVAGDLVSHSLDESAAVEQAKWVVSRLKAPLGVLLVNGDVDDVVEGGVRRVVEGLPVRLLLNESALLQSDPPVEVLGADPRDLSAFERLLQAPRRAPIRIGLVHRPRFYRPLGAAGCELVLAGHTHGGQVVVPGFGPIVTLEVVPRRVAAGGLHEMEDGTLLYVSRGLGLEGGFAPPVRFLCPPEITLLRLGPGSSVAAAAPDAVGAPAAGSSPNGTR